MTPNEYFKALFKVEISRVKADLIALLEIADQSTFLNWSELNLSKRPNVLENIYTYSFIKKELRGSGLFKGLYDPKLVNLTLVAFQGAYESMLRKSCIVLFEATKLKFHKSAWYDEAFRKKEKNYNTSDIITFIKDCLVEEGRATGSFLSLSQVMIELHLSRLNKIRNAIAHNIYVVEGTTEADSRICYSETDQRCYFTKDEYQKIQTSQVFKMLDMMDMFRDLFLDCLRQVTDNFPNFNMVFCECGMQAFTDLADIPNKRCYFCNEVGKFKPGGVSIARYLPPLP